MAQLLGEILVAQGWADQEQIDEGLDYQNQTGVKLGQALTHLGHVTEDQLARGLAKQASLPYVDLSKGRIAPEVIELVPGNLAEEYNIIPVKVQGKHVIVALADPLAVFNLENLRFLLNLEFRCALTTESGLRDAFKKYYEVDKQSVEQTAAKAKRDDEDDDAPVIRLVDQLIEEAVRVRASDIHVEGFQEELRIRFRVDGVCKTVARHPRHLHGPVVSRFKILAGMDISEKRKPQDGRVMTKALGKEIDMRASILPAIHGESMVLRILDKVEGLVSLEKLGFTGDDHARFNRIIKRPNGIFLVTGPTGSGKTTTLYAALKELNRPDVKIITAENPVEYNIVGINQCQVRHTIGLDFGRILRAMLRQAPNIILIGEIRDEETASIAIQAALTGHLVFSTLHTNDAPSAITRLTDMGVKPFMAASSIVAVLAQRLIRTLCKHCRVPHQPSEADLKMIGLDLSQLEGHTVYQAGGCDRCNSNGYSGRVGIYELMEMDNELRELAFQAASHVELRRQATASGMTSLRGDGARKVLEGITSIDEVLRVVSQEVSAE